jgi:RNA polymerase sigma-54 factor
MAMLQHKLNLKVSQKQVLTPGLVQMVNVLALNKMELREMINNEIVENPVLEELDENIPILDDAERNEEPVAALPETADGEKTSDPFDEIDFGTYFQEYLDPGFRTPSSFEMTERPSFENFLSRGATLMDHLQWQLGAMSLGPELALVTDMILGNLDEDGYLTASEEELREALAQDRAFAGHDMDALLTEAMAIVRALDPPGTGARDLRECLLAQIAAARLLLDSIEQAGSNIVQLAAAETNAEEEQEYLSPLSETQPSPQPVSSSGRSQLFDDAQRIIEQHLALLQKRDFRDLGRAMRRPAEAVSDAVAFIRTLDPRPGQRYNREEARLIEPDVAILKRDDGYVAVLNDEDLPVLRLNHSYRRMLSEQTTERDVKSYVKERFKSAIQLMRNIEQRKSTILRVCDSIIRRQHEFFERGVEALQPMMIKEIAEEIGVHPSTVSRAVSNKYVHTSQGVYELRFFFSEGANGPEGGNTPLMLLKRKVKKIIEQEDASHPLTDDQIAAMLQEQGIQVTRRTVAKYREDLRIPSTHQRRVRQQPQTAT